eukprot:SAG11_NODE_5554_length_1526_cov_2.779958_2_plen_78_part_00
MLMVLWTLLLPAFCFDDNGGGGQRAPTTGDSAESSSGGGGGFAALFIGLKASWYAAAAAGITSTVAIGASNELDGGC